MQKAIEKRTAWFIQAHHPDYSKPLEVIYLCVYCHHKLHVEMGAYKNNGRQRANPNPDVASITPEGE